MVRRKIRKSRYLVALIITALVFVSGVFLTFLFDDERAEFVAREARMQKLDFDSLQLQYLYLDRIEGEKNCDAATKTLEKNIVELDKMKERVERYNEETYSGDKEDFQTLRREYTLAEIRYWLFVARAKEICPMDSVSVLYFYGAQCGDCGGQATILTHLKHEFENKLLVFALDADFLDEAMIDILKASYGIEATPTLIIEDKKYEGLQTKEDILKVICSYYEEEYPKCEGY
jgi:thiol-disulfide isomerase/thioredoxin